MLHGMYDLVFMGDVVDGLVYDVHEDGWEVGNNKNACEFPIHDQPHLHCPSGAYFHFTWDQVPCRQNILLNKRGAKIFDGKWCEFCGIICRS